MKKWFLLLIAGVALLHAEPDNSVFNNGNANYKQRDVMCNKEELFEGLKKTLIQSNLNILTVSKENGVITAKGDQYNNETITEVMVSITFKPIADDITNVAMIGSYNVMEKKSNTGQLGFAGFSLPIPVPLTGRYAVVGSGQIEDSLWYEGFFNSLDKILFEEKMKSLH